jgi:hypothetical protein
MKRRSLVLGLAFALLAARIAAQGSRVPTVALNTHTHRAQQVESLHDLLRVDQSAALLTFTAMFTGIVEDVQELGDGTFTVSARADRTSTLVVVAGVNVPAVAAGQRVLVGTQLAESRTQANRVVHLTTALEEAAALCALREHDVALPLAEWTLLFAGADGTVTDVGFSPNDLGNFVKVAYADAVEVTYFHIAKLYVARDQKLAAGHLLAESGWTGRVLVPSLGLRLTRNAVRPSIVVITSRK